MSEFYAAGNNESTKALFLKRTYYRGTTTDSKNLSNLVDFNFGEKYFYGRVNRFFMPMHYVNRTIALKGLTGNDENGVPLRAMSFVVDAFKDLSQQFNKCALTGKIDNNDLFLSSLKVYKAFEDPVVQYNKYLASTLDVVAMQFIKGKVVFKNFDEFINELMGFLIALTRIYPITMPAYIKSKYCSITTSGLAIEIADLDASNDNIKAEQFVHSLNWDFYVNACNTYGFMIDKFVPWRLVADIGSAPMLQYAKNYPFLNSTDAIINLGYSTSQNDFYNKFKYYLLNLYNKVKGKGFLVTEDCGGITQAKLVVPEEYDIAKLTSKYNEIYFLKLYFTLRFNEEVSPFDEGDRTRLIDNAIEMYMSQRIEKSLYNFERILSKPFDYRGSLSYINKHQQAVRDSEGP